MTYSLNSYRLDPQMTVPTKDEPPLGTYLTTPHEISDETTVHSAGADLGFLLGRRLRDACFQTSEGDTMTAESGFLTSEGGTMTRGYD